MKQALVRLAVLMVLFINQTLILFGWSPLPFSEEQLYEGLSSFALVITMLWSWWKNNNVTPEAQEADQYRKELKAMRERK